MTTSPTTSQFPNFISTDNPIFNQPSTDYALLDADGNLAERYRHLPRDTQAYILAEHQAGREKNALRVANCHTTGVVYEECENGDTARAHSNLCHDDGCPGCGTARTQLYVWTATRDEQKLYHTPHQFGIELIIPKGESNGSPDKAVTFQVSPSRQPSRQQSSMLPTKNLSHPEDAGAIRADANGGSCSPGDARSLRQGRDRMLDAAGKFFRSLERDGVSAVIADVVDGGGDTRIRAVLENCHKNYRALLKLWKEEAPQGEISLRRDLEGKKLLTWAFLLTEPLLLKNGATRSQILAAFRNCHLIRTVGGFYSPLSELELKARKDKTDSVRCRCSRCKGKMVKVPLENRYSESPDTINHRYVSVDWTSERSDRNLTAMTPIAVRSAQDLTMWAAPTHSPPS